MQEDSDLIGYVIEGNDIYVYGEVKSELIEYVPLLNYLNNASYKDRVVIHLQSYGGDCHTACVLSHAIRNTDAFTEIVVEGPSYSAGAIIALAGNNTELLPGTFLMFHNYSTVESGKAGTMKIGLEHYSRHYINMIQYFCQPFLTDMEVKKIKNDQDVYIHWDDKGLDVRLERHHQINNNDEGKN